MAPKNEKKIRKNVDLGWGYPDIFPEVWEIERIQSAKVSWYIGAMG